MRSSAAGISLSGVEVTGSGLIHAVTGVSPGAAPAATARARSRSVRMPTTVLSRTTTAELTSRRRMASAAAASVSVGAAVRGAGVIRSRRCSSMARPPFSSY
jgi:hypothetical protein